MEYGKPYSFRSAEIPGKHREQKNRSDRFGSQDHQQDQADQTDDAARLRRRNRVLHRAPLPDPDPPAGNQKDS